MTRFSIVGPRTLSGAFADGTEQRIDVTPVLHGVLFGPLRKTTHLLDVVVLARDLPAHGLRRGDLGAVVVWRDPEPPRLMLSVRRQ